MVKIFKIVLVIIIFSCFHIFYQEKEKINLETSYYNTSNRNITIENDYYMLLEIPSIKLNKKIYEINSIENNIDKNVMLLYEGYTTIIVSHSGNNYNAYFRNLKKLNIDDDIILSKDKFKKFYKVNKIWYLSKKDAFRLKKEYKDKLVLITCLDKEKYLIIECILQ